MDTRKHYKDGTATVRIFLLLLLWIGLAQPTAADSLKLQHFFHTKSPWEATIVSKDDSISVCFSSDAPMMSCTPVFFTVDKTHYPANKVRHLGILENPLLLELISEFSDNGSGLLIKLEYWYYDATSDRFKVAGNIPLSEQSEYGWYNGMLLTADAQINAGETHFSPHHFNIASYHYVPEKGLKQVMRYTTQKRYASLDAGDEIKVISQELSVICKKLPSPHQRKLTICNERR